jgi:hypothetical protein
MEPAVTGGITRVGLGEQVGDFPAAMEPVAGRREHVIGVNAANNDAIRPQWGPPSNGGSTPPGSP